MRSLWWHCWTLCALAVAPVIDVIRRDPAFLLANDFSLSRLLLFLAALLLVAPLPLVLAARRLRDSTSPWPALLLAPPAFAIALYLGGRAGLELGRLLPAAAFAALLCWGYSRFPALRSYLGWLALVALVAPIQLLCDAGVRRVIAPGDPVVAAGAGDSTGPPIAILLLDELPTSTLIDAGGGIDRRRFPNLAALADRAHWYPNYWSTDPATERAVTALLAGRVPPDDALPVARDHPRNLFTLLAPHYRVSASETVTRLCPRDLNTLARRTSLLGDYSWLLDTATVALHLWTPQPWAGSLLPALERDWQRFPSRATAQRPRARPDSLWRRWLGPPRAARGRDRVTKFRSALAAIDASGGAALHFVHLMLPHRPWIYLPAGEGYLADGLREMKDFGRERWPDHPAVAYRAYQRHLLQAEFTDRLVGEFLERLRTTGLFDRAVVVVTADHGISFRPGERVRKLGPSNREDLLRVPLLVKLPGQQDGARHTAARSALDLLPTVLELAGVAAPPLEGQSLLAPEAPAGGADPTEPKPDPPPDLSHRTSVFGALTAERDLFHFGPYSEWIGRAELQLEPHPEARLALLGHGERVRRETAASTVPAWVYGWLESGTDLAGYGIAVTVDGRVAATGECERIEGRNRFNVLLPPEALPPGEHLLDIYLIAPGGGQAWRLPRV